MNIIEIKNNLVKLSYEEDLKLASFIKITDITKSYIAQIIHIEATRIGKVAIARLIFNYTATIQAYDGSIPSIQADVELLDDHFYVNQLDKKDGILIGQLPTSNTDVIVSSNILKDRPIICAEKNYQSNVLIENILKQNELNERKTIILDLSGQVKGNKITATKDFRLPLDKKSIDYIFENGFTDLTPENKAYIQDIFSEIRDYLNTVDYIPFKDFNNVIEAEFNRTQQLQLIILKNRLSQFNKSGLFAQTKEEFLILDNKLANDNTLVIDLSLLNAQFQQEYMAYIYEQMEKKNNNFYTIAQIDNNNSSDSLLHKILGAKNVFTSIICPYNYRYLAQLKQCSKNMVMFTPMKQINDFGAYNVFLNRLAENEFILYGKTTKFIPLILKMNEIDSFSEVLTPEKESIPELAEEYKEQQSVPTVKDEEIFSTITEQPLLTNFDNKPVEQINSIPEEEEEIDEYEENIYNDLQEEQKDIKEDIHETAELIDNNTIENTTEPIEEYNNIDEIQESTAAHIDKTDNEIYEKIELNNENSLEEDFQEIIKPEEDFLDKSSADNTPPDIEQELESEFDEISIDISDEEIAEAIERPIENISPIVEEPSESNQDSEIIAAEDDSFLDELSDDELSDDDLDLIEELDTEDNITSDVDAYAENKPEEEEEEEEEINPISTEELMPAFEENSENNEEVQEHIPDEVFEQETESHTAEQESIEKSIEETTVQPKKQSITDEILQEEAIKQAQLDNAPKEDPIEKHIEPATPNKSGLETKQAETPDVPVYSAEIPDEDIVESDPIQPGDVIEHTEFGRGIVEKIINYGERTLCSINFDQIGRRLLDPKVSELKRV